MKTLILLALLAAAFLAGYYFGQQPDSPDVFGWAQTTWQRLTDAGRQAGQAVGILTADTAENGDKSD